MKDSMSFAVGKDDDVQRTALGEDLGDEPRLSGPVDKIAQKRANYALALQTSCRDVLHSIKASDLLVNSDWAKPLTQAPNAISIMALCLKTAATPEVASIKVSNTTITDETGNKLGELPSEFFYTNLQHCADIGRLAFGDAQKRMNQLQSDARSMIAQGGIISYIIDLLDDLEDARDNLPEAMSRLATNAERFKNDSRSIVEKFEYWQKVIMHLHKTSMDEKAKRGIRIEENANEANEADAQRLKGEHDEITAKGAVEEQQKLLQMAQKQIQKAQQELDDLLDEPHTQDPSAWEEFLMARKLIPDQPAPSRGEKGIFTQVREFFGGTSDEELAAERDHQESHAEAIAKERQYLINKAKEERESQRRIAQSRLDEARENEARRWEELSKQQEKLWTSHYNLTKAKHDLGKTHAELERLGSEKIELKQIVQILAESMRRLTELKKEVAEMAIFFGSVHTVITTTVYEHLQSFLDPIRKMVAKGETVDKIRDRSKKNLLANAFELQGRFSATADVASMYVLVSNKYIKPGIDRMERLAAMDDADFDRSKVDFRQWCIDAAEDIAQITEREQPKMAENITRNVESLKLKAIQAAGCNTNVAGY